jgi:hypothetical protein
MDRSRTAREGTADGGPVGVGRAPPLLVGLAWVALATALQVARQRGAPAYDSLWAEDGAVFLEDAVARGIPAIFTPQASYLLLGPRLLGALASILPLELAPLVLSVGPAAITALLSLYVYRVSAELLTSRLGRGVVAGTMILAPWAVDEVVNTATNLPWYLAFACFWAVLRKPSSRAEAGVSTLVVAVATLSTPVTALYAPVAVWRVVKADRPLQRLIPSVFFAGLLIQLPFLFGEEPLRWGASSAFDILPLYALRIGGVFLTGNRFADELWRWLGWGFAYGALGAILVLVSLGAWKSDRGRRLAIVGLFGYSLVSFGAVVWIRGVTGFLVPLERTLYLAGARYTFVPLLFLAATVTCVVEATFAGLPRRPARVIRLMGPTLVAALIAVNFVFVRSPGPTWNEQLSLARGRCAGVGQVVRVPIAPPGVTVMLDCGRLLRIV